MENFIDIVKPNCKVRSNTKHNFNAFVGFLSPVLLFSLSIFTIRLSLAILGLIVIYGTDEIMHNTRNIITIKEQFKADLQ